MKLQTALDGRGERLPRCATQILAGRRSFAGNVCNARNGNTIFLEVCGVLSDAITIDRGENARVRAMKFTCSVMVGLILGGAATIADARDQTPNTQQAAEEKAVNLCSSCHGPRGISTSPEFPNLAAQREVYTIGQLEAFAKRARADKDAHDYMWGIAGQLDEGIIGGIARYYAAQPPALGRVEHLALAMKGKEVFEGGAPDRGIPPCAACHGQNAEGIGEFPRLAGQHAKYITKQVGYIQAQTRPTAVKHDFVKDLTPEETQAVAAYVQSK